jgi:flavin reductase (DIM6/NTAB) family NADH-FMN oxidoreductase RutF
VASYEVFAGSQGFEKVVALLDYPMFVVTTRVGDERAGCLVGFSSQVSIDPPRFLVALSRLNHTYRVAERGATALSVQVLAKEHRELARLFGGETGDRVDKFSRCRWWEGPEGLPIPADAAAWFAGRILDRFDLGDHVGHLIEPVAGAAPEQFGELVTYTDVKDLAPGHGIRPGGRQ